MYVGDDEAVDNAVSNKGRYALVIAGVIACWLLLRSDRGRT